MEILHENSPLNAIGVISQDRAGWGYEFEVDFESALWPNAVDATLVFDDLEFAINDDDFFDLVPIDGRANCSLEITVLDGQFSGVITSEIALPELSEGDRMVVEHPCVKSMFAAFHEQLCPEIECALSEDRQTILIAYQDYLRLLNGLTTTEFLRQPCIAMQASVQRMSGTGPSSRLNGRRVHLLDKKVVFLDRDSSPTTEGAGTEVVRITFGAYAIGGTKARSKAIGEVPSELSGGSTITIRMAGTEPSRQQLYKPFERAYILNIGRTAVDDRQPFNETESGSFEWLGVDIGFDASGLRFRQYLEDLHELFNYMGTTGSGFISDELLMRRGRAIIAKLSQLRDEGRLRGSSIIQTSAFESFSGPRSVAVNPDIATQVSNSEFVQTISVITSYQTLELKYGRKLSATKQNRLLFSCPLTDSQRLSVTAFLGHNLTLKPDDIQAEVLCVGELMYLSVSSAEPKYTKFSDNFNTHGHTKQTNISVGAATDSMNTFRTQGLDNADSLSVRPGTQIRLYPGDYIKSLASADDQMLYSRIALTSQDLLVQPVISSGFRSLLLHSFPLPHDYTASVDDNFAVSGMSSGIPGTLSWRDRGGEAIVHPIQMGSASLRHFKVSAALKPRDSSQISSKQIMLPRGGIFEVTLIFMKDFSAK